MTTFIQLPKKDKSPSKCCLTMCTDWSWALENATFLVTHPLLFTPVAKLYYDAVMRDLMSQSWSNLWFSWVIYARAVFIFLREGAILVKEAKILQQRELLGAVCLCFDVISESR